MSEEELQPMKPVGSGYTMYVLPNEELTMRKALYYDFMLYQRTLKPFNSFLIKSGLTNSTYQQVTAPPAMATMASSGMTMSTVKNENLLHESLQQFLAQKPGALEIIETRVYTLDQLFRMNGLNNDLFTPKTSEQIDANIGMLVSNIAAGRTYDCSKDAVMTAIVNGRFDEYLSEQNKQQMMRICGPVAAEAAEAAAAAEALPQKEKGFFSSLFGLGGRKMKRSNKRSNKRSTKHSNKRSNKRSNRRSKKHSNTRSKKHSKSDKKYKGGSPPSYIGSTQGKYMNLDGKQLMTNPVGGIA